jgi:hypothetical protein
MDIYIKTFNSESENPSSFILSSNIGSIVPSTVSLNELLDGKIFSLSDENATQVILSAQGFQSKTVVINKDASSCFQTSAANYIEGNARPRNQDGSKAPFRTQSADSAIVNNIFNLNIGEEFSLQIFENTPAFTLLDKTTLGDEITIQATENNSETSWILISKNTITNEVNFIYDCHATAPVKYSSTDSTIKEWVTSDLITICNFE